jgi:hypothetical protein
MVCGKSLLNTFLHPLKTKNRLAPKERNIIAQLKERALGEQRRAGYSGNSDFKP